MTLVQPLNLEYWLLQVFAGSPYIFIGVAVIVLAGLAAKFRMNTWTFGLMLMLFAAMFAVIADWFLLIAVLIAGFLIYFTLGRLFRT